jgi:hypothetical protein
MSSSAGRAKRDREKARQEKAAIKRDKRLNDTPTDDADQADAGPVAPQADVLAELEALHKRFDDGQINFEDFEERKAHLISQLSI